MKKLLLIGIWLLLSQLMVAQTDWAKRLQSSFMSANATELATSFGNEMEVSILGQSGIVEAKSAQQLLQNFFAEHAPQSCTVSHQGTRETSSFFILSYQDTQAHTYRVYCVVRKSEEGQFVKQFRIDYVR